MFLLLVINFVLGMLITVFELGVVGLIVLGLRALGLVT